MKHDNDKKWLESLLSQYLHREPEKFDFEKWAEIHSDEAQLLQSGYQHTDRTIKTKHNKICSD